MPSTPRPSLFAVLVAASALLAACTGSGGRSEADGPSTSVHSSGAPSTSSPSAGESGEPAALPPLGWNSWNTFRCGIDEGLIRSSADAMVSSGLRDAGYRYVVIDDCWFDPVRGDDGRLRSNPTTFPSGIKALADHVHGLGLRLGIYSVPGDMTCAPMHARSGRTDGAGPSARSLAPARTRAAAESGVCGGSAATPGG